MSTHWDRAAALHRLDGDEPLLEELIGVFFQDYPTVSERLSQALLCGDLDSACETAHSSERQFGLYRIQRCRGPGLGN